jgi:hypothetical protein
MYRKTETHPISSFPSADPAERRAAVQLAEQERAQSRSRELESQTATHIAPDERIRIWERLHALRLPTSASHPLMALIAAQTNLSVGELRDEQERRRSPAATLSTPA